MKSRTTGDMCETPGPLVLDVLSRTNTESRPRLRASQASVTVELEMESQRGHFERISSTFGASIGRCARSYARSASEREDLEQDIALAIWRALPSFRGECSERTFVLRIAHNQALSALTRRRGRPPVDELGEEPPSEAPDPEMLADLSQRMRTVFRAIHVLPFGQRQVLVLALEGLSHEEIAEVVGISAGNVAVRVSRARSELKKLLGEK